MPKKILFIDDDERLLAGLRRLLSSQRSVWDMRFANTVDHAYEVISQNKIDVVILDISMPKQNGFELLKHIKKDSAYSGTEVIMLTGLKNKDLKRRALNLGATDLINKPISKEDLTARINSVLRTKSYRDSLVEKNRLLEDQLIQSQKMQIVGILAAGVIHDLKNILSIIRGYPDIIQLRIQKDKPVEKHLNKIKNAVDRAKQLTLQILELSRPDPDTVKTCNLAEIIKEASNIVQPILAKNIDFSIEIPSDKAYINANATQITQILLNLFINAHQAIPINNGGGKINVALSTEKIMDHGKCPNGKYHKLTVADSGQGMDQETLNKIFIPRYTQKNKSGGFGLGLFIVQTVVKRHNGFIKVESKPNQGTTFKVLFPAYEN